MLELWTKNTRLIPELFRSELLKVSYSCYLNHLHRYKALPEFIEDEITVRTQIWQNDFNCVTVDAGTSDTSYFRTGDRYNVFYQLQSAFILTYRWDLPEHPRNVEAYCGVRSTTPCSRTWISALRSSTRIISQNERDRHGFKNHRFSTYSGDFGA